MTSIDPSPERVPSPSRSRSAIAGPAVVALAVVAAFLMALQPVRSADVWHHVKAGWLVTQNKGPAETEVFSCTAQGKTWVQYEWLAQFLIHLVHEKTGLSGLVLARALAVAAVATLLLFACRARGVEWTSAGLAVTLAMCGISGRFWTRPELFTWVLFAALLLVVEKIRAGRHKLLFLLPLLVVPWVSTHGAWIAGLAWLGLICGTETVTCALKHRRAVPKKTLNLLWLGLALAFVATLVNPYTLHIWEVPFKLAGSSEVTKSIGEWQTPGLDHWLNPRHIAAWILLLAMVVAPLKARLADWLVFLFFGILALTARRHLAITLLVCAPILASQLDAFAGLAVPKGRWKALLQRVPIRTALTAAACTVLVILALGGFSLPRAGLGLVEEKYPIGAAEFLESEGLRGNIFNRYAHGNYLLFALYPDNHVFIDGRVDMYGAEIVTLYGRVLNAAQGWQAVLARYDIDVCVVRTNEEISAPILRALHRARDWKLVYWDNVAAVYVQRTEQRKPFLDKAYIYAVSPHDVDDSMLRSPAGLQRAEKDYTRKLEGDKTCGLALTGLDRVAAAYLARGAHPRALALLKKAQRLRPDHAGANYSLASCLLVMNRRDEAEAYFSNVLKLGEYQGESYLALAVIHHGRGQLDEALIHLRAALRHNPDNWRIHWNMSQICEQQGDLKGALSAARKATTLSPPPELDVSERIRRLKQQLDQQGSRQ